MILLQSFKPIEFNKLQAGNVSISNLLNGIALTGKWDDCVISCETNPTQKWEMDTYPTCHLLSEMCIVIDCIHKGAI